MSEADIKVPASEVLREIAARDPRRLALEAGDDRMTYAELDAVSVCGAAALRSRLGRGRHHVVLCIASTKALFVASFAVARAGFVSVPVDPTVPVEFVRAVCAEVEASLVLSDLPVLDAGGPAVIHPFELGGEPPHDWEDVPRGECVSIVFTSGSTGEPKGILVSAAQRALVGLLADGSETTLRGGMIAAGSNGVAEVTLQTFIGMGATVVAYDLRRDGLKGFGSWLRDAQVFGLYAVPTLLRHLLATLDDDDVIEGTTIGLGGEVATWEDIVEIRRHLGRGARIVHLFASSEAGGVLHYPINADTETGVGSLPLGVPLPGRTVELLDEDGQPVPAGEVGEIVVTSRDTALGYWKRPEETATVFTDLGGGLRRVRTGDLGRLLADGSVEYGGRADHMVKIAGNRVELGHLEATLRLLDGVADAAARTYVDDAGELRLTAAVVAGEGSALHPSVLRLELARRLPAPTLPDGIAVLDELPRLPGGKVDRRRLPVARTLPREASAPPQTDLERRILQRWRDVLGVDDLGVEDDFFTVGGDSLRGARLIIGLNEELGVDLPVSVLVEAPTVRRLADLLDAGSGWSPLVAARSEGAGPPLFVVHDVFGEVVHTRQLSTLLPDGFPIYGLLGQALDGRPIPEKSLEELAARYIAAIRTVRPHGPYRLYGASAGGTIAFEMARQLRESGEEVPVLVLGDSTTPGFGTRDRAAARLSELRAMPVVKAGAHAIRLTARQLAFRTRRLTAWATGSDRRRYARYAAVEELLRKAAVGEATVPVDLRGQFAQRVYSALTAGYIPDGEYYGPVTVLRCDESTFPNEPWNRYVTRPCTQVPIGGNHFDLAKESGLRKAARVLAGEIQPASDASPNDDAGS